MRPQIIEIIASSFPPLQGGYRIQLPSPSRGGLGWGWGSECLDYRVDISQHFIPPEHEHLKSGSMQAFVTHFTALAYKKLPTSYCNN
jgi:hypothetical protein